MTFSLAGMLLSLSPTSPTATGTLMPLLASLVRAPALPLAPLVPHRFFSPSRSSPILGLEHRPFGHLLLATFCLSFATAFFITPASGLGFSLPCSLLTPSFALPSTPPLASLGRVGPLFGCSSGVVQGFRVYAPWTSLRLVPLLTLVVLSFADHYSSSRTA